MLLVAAVVVVLALAALAGRDLSRLGALHVAGVAWLVAALVAQTALVSLPQVGPDALYAVVHVATYVVLGGVLWANRRLPWLWLIALGGAANALVIAVNGGVMPASGPALEAVGRAGEDGFANSAAASGAHLPWLGDVLHTPAWLPLANVFSVGDVVLVVGVALLVWATTAPEHATDPAAVG